MRDPWAYRSPFFNPYGFYNPYYPGYGYRYGFAYPFFPYGLGYGLGGYGMGGYGMGGYGGGMYGMMNLPGSSGSGSGGGGGGNQNGAQNGGQNNNAGRPAPNGGLGAVLAAAGVPLSAHGIDWPLVLQALPGAKHLRQKIEGQFLVAAEQASSGSISPALPLETYRSIEKLEHMLVRNKVERVTFSTAMYEQGERFLGHLKEAARELLAVARSSGPAPYPPMAAAYH